MRAKRIITIVNISRVRYCSGFFWKKPVTFAITGLKNLSKLYQNGELLDEPKISYPSRIIKKLISRLSIKPINDHTSCMILINTIQREIVPVARMEVISCATMDKIPSDKIGEKSTIPIRVKLNRLNQLRYGSQIDDNTLPNDEYAAEGTHESKILIKHKKR